MRITWIPAKASSSRLSYAPVLVAVFSLALLSAATGATGSVPPVRHVSAAGMADRVETAVDLDSQPLRQIAVTSPQRVADSSYLDRTGDATGGAPDVTTIRVLNDQAGTITFQVSVLGFPVPESTVDIIVDYDQNASTGDEGDDFWFELDSANSGTYGYRWDGVNWVDWVPPTGRAGFANGVWTVSVNRSDLNGTTRFDFYVYSVKYSGQQEIGADEADQLLSYTLTQAPPPQPPPPPKPEPRSYEDASRLPSRIRYVGKSIKHVRLGENLYDTMKRLAAEGKIRVPRVVAVACWSKSDWPSVAESAGFDGNPNLLSGFWLDLQPRWVHIAPKECSDVQALMLTRQSNGQRAYALATVLHERVHAEGVVREAETNCYGVQLVYDFARELNFVHVKALRLEQLAVRKARLAPRGYWDPVRCRDGGAWDIYDEFRNLTY